MGHGTSPVTATKHSLEVYVAIGSVLTKERTCGTSCEMPQGFVHDAIAKYGMTSKRNYLAIDLGAESGRAMLGRFDGARLTIAEIKRFPNTPLRTASGLHWNVHQLVAEIRDAIAACASSGTFLDSIGIDSWGVDYGLLDANGELLDLPFHYRDDRTAGMVERV